MGIWTGRDLLVWGGELRGGRGNANTGGRYNPRADTWTPLTTRGAPVGRALPAMVWTGREVIIWGGVDALNSPLNTGAVYDP